MQIASRIFHALTGAVFSLLGPAAIAAYVLALLTAHPSLRPLDRLAQWAGFTNAQEMAAGPTDGMGKLAWWSGWLGDGGRLFAAARLREGTDVLMAAPMESLALQTHFDELNYFLPEQDTKPGTRVEVPRLYVRSLPQNLAEGDNSWARKRDFIRTLLPLVLAENEAIQKDRARAQRLMQQIVNGHKLYSANRTWLVNLAARYGVEGFEPVNGDWKELLRRVDGVPPSMALAQAAVESGWGASRFARHGNAVFGQWSWKPGSGIIPAGRDRDGGHEVRRFDKLSESVGAYLNNLNTHQYYAKFREQRAATRADGELAPGMELIKYLDRYSREGKKYIKDLRAVIETNALQDLDDAKLRPAIGAGLTSS